MRGRRDEGTLIDALNQFLRGWAGYFRTASEVEWALDLDRHVAAAVARRLPSGLRPASVEPYAEQLRVRGLVSVRELCGGAAAALD